jgi:tetratricopeptide (TPR) repeat protein
MSSLLVGLLSALMASNAPAATSNLLLNTTGISVNVPIPYDPVERELEKLMEEDDAAQAEVDGWIRENRAFAAKGGGVPNAELNRRIFRRFEPVRQAYTDFLKRHPKSVDGHIAYASFLNDIGEMEASVAELEKASKLDPKDPAIWNNLGVYYGDGHHGPVIKSFPCFEKAIELAPRESLYYHNFATTVCMYRRDAQEYYHITDRQVFDKSLELYAKALQFDPTNFLLATDLATTYYLMRPVPAEPALAAWTNALRVADNEIEREGVYLHLARIKIYYLGHFAEAQAHLNAVTNDVFAELKKRLQRNLDAREKQAQETNHPPAAATTGAAPPAREKPDPAP